MTTAARVRDPSLCKECHSRPHQRDRSRCADCAERRREEAAATRAERRQKGLCLTCGKRARPGRRYCQTHRAYYAARAAARAAS